MNKTAMRLRFLFMFLSIAMAICFIFTLLQNARADQSGQVFRGCPDCPQMVVIPPGSFLMGSSESDSSRDIAAVTGLYREFAKRAAEGASRAEYPQHTVTIGRKFALGKYPVTWGEFQAFIHETGYVADGPCTVSINHHYFQSSDASWGSPGYVQSDQSPVVCVSWNDAKAYITWLNKKVAQANKPNRAVYRLPTEAEWEYAARARTITARWWGDEIGSNKAVCTGCGSRWDEMQAAPVGSFAPNAFGLYDMIGNVSQWTEDCQSADYGGAPNDGSAWLRDRCIQRTARGGGWTSDSWAVRSAYRTHFALTRRLSSLGFRLAADFNAIPAE